MKLSEKKYQVDIRPVQCAGFTRLNNVRLEEYQKSLLAGKPNLTKLTELESFELMSMTRDGQSTLKKSLFQCKITKFRITFW